MTRVIMRTFIRESAVPLRLWLLLVFLASAIAAQPTPYPGGPTTMVKYSAVVLDGSGAPRSGVFTLTFSLYSDPYVGSALWSEQQSVTLDAAGHYTVLLGASAALSTGLFPSGEQRWLGVQIGSDPELSRVLLVSQPYAITASNADQLGGYAAGEYVLHSQLPGALTALQSSLPAWPHSSLAAAYTTNVIPKATSNGQLVNSAIYESNGLVGIGTTNPTQTLQINGNLWLTGQTTHQFQFTGVASSGRFGQDLVGPFLASDTPGKAIRLVTSGVAERMRITDAGKVGIATANPTTTLEVAGAVKISGAGSGLTFPDGSTQTTAAFPSVLAPGTVVSNQEVHTLTADQSATIGSSPGTSGQVAIMPDNLDSVHSYIGQAGQQTHFRLSRATPDANGARDFMITPYLYGMGIEYPGVIEVWSDDFSVHFNHQLTGQTNSARFWVGDEIDSGGLFATAFDNGGGSNSYTALASDRFSHTSHGPLVFQVRNPSDSFKFQWGAYNSEVTRAALTNSSTATNLSLMYGAVQGTVTADSSGSGAVNVGSVSPTPVNLVAGNLPQLTVFPDGNVSVGSAGDTALLAVGSGSQFTVNHVGAVTAAAVNTASLTAGSVASGSVTTAALNAGSLTASSLSAANLNSGAEATSSLTVGGGTPILDHLSLISTISFVSFPANGCLTQTVAVPGASDGDSIALGIPNVLGSVGGLTWFGWASSPDTVSIRGCNATVVATAAPGPAPVRIDVWKH
jgi:hypothetical protein